MKDGITGVLKEKIVWPTHNIFVLPRDLQMLWKKDLQHHPMILYSRRVLHTQPVNHTIISGEEI